jgi:transcriptional regulator with XRE-family HTH domain
LDKKMARKRPMSYRQELVARRAKEAFRKKQAAEKMTLQEASRAIGWSDSVLGQYLNANIPMGIEAVARVANYLNVSPYELDPELAEALPAQPEDVQSLEKSLSLLSEAELSRLMKKLVSRLPAKDVSRLMTVLLDRLDESL